MNTKDSHQDKSVSIISTSSLQQQQQQQQSLLPESCWGRIEMKPKKTVAIRVKRKKTNKVQEE
jgi:hypothetical protein